MYKNLYKKSRINEYSYPELKTQDLSTQNLGKAPLKKISNF